MVLLVSDSFMVRTLRAFIFLQSVQLLKLCQSFSLMVSVETENCSERGVQFALFLLEASEGFVVLFYSINLLK